MDLANLLREQSETLALVEQQLGYYRVEFQRHCEAVDRVRNIGAVRYERSEYLRHCQTLERRIMTLLAGQFDATAQAIREVTG